MSDVFAVARRFNGPPRSGNGGYVAGKLAAYVEGPCAVRLIAPPPLDTDLTVRRDGDGLELVSNGTPIARARPTRVDLVTPAPPTFEEAVTAARHYKGFESHEFPTCFVCGPERDRGDGLRIFAGPVEGRENLVAAPWVSHASLAGEGDVVAAEFVWAALDCPGAFAFRKQPDGPVLLGELAVRRSHPVHVGERCVVTGWEIAHEGRKHYTGTALYGESGICCAIGMATWIEVARTVP